MDTHPKQFILNWADDLTAAFARSERDFVRPLDRGAPREETLRQLFRSFLPGRYGVTSGHVVSARPAWSRQADIIIYNSLECPVLSRQSGFQGDVLPLEGVHGILEVKSTLTEQDFQDGLDKIADFKRLCLDDDAKDIPIRRFGGLFFFRLPPDVKAGSDAEAKLLSSCLDKCRQVESDLVPDLAVVLGAPEPQTGRATGGRLFFKDQFRGGMVYIENKDMPVLPVFLHQLLAHLRNVATGYPEMFWYLFDKRDFHMQSAPVQQNDTEQIRPASWGCLGKHEMGELASLGGICPACKGKEWSVQPNIFVLPRLKDSLVGSIPGNTFNAIALACNSCGHLALHSLDTLVKASAPSV